MRHLSTALLVLALLVPAVRPVRAESSPAIEQTQQRLNAVRQKAMQAETELATVAAQAEVAEAEYELADQRRAKAEWALQTITAEAAQVTAQVQQLEAELAQSRERLAQRREVVADRMRSLQERGRVSYLEVLFGATSFTDFTSRLEWLGAILRKDRAVFEGVKQETALIEERQQAAVERQQQLAALQAEALAKQQEVAEQASIREVASRSLAASRRQLQAQLAELRAEEDQVLYEIARLQAAQQNPASGPFSPILPVPGPGLVTSYFGPRYIFGGWNDHGGVDFNARYGSPILAVESGVVVIAGWGGGYGYYIVIDHGGGISTLYGHNSELLVGVGDQVTKGQQIAKAGSTGKSTGPHCHLEIVVNGQRRNFLEYIPSNWYTATSDA